MRVGGDTSNQEGWDLWVSLPTLMAKVKIQENSQIKLFCKIPIIQGLKKDFKFQLVLWASISHISLAQGHFLLVSVYDFSRGWFACTLGQVY